jgi:hypothetical protein
MVVHEWNRDLVVGSEGGAPEGKELGETQLKVEYAARGERGASGGGGEGRLGQLLVVVVAIPEVECELGER